MNENGRKLKQTLTLWVQHIKFCKILLIGNIMRF